MGIDDFGFLWVSGFCADSHKFFCGYGIGMGTEIPTAALALGDTASRIYEGALLPTLAVL